MHPGDTIVAISTPPGRGGLGIVRLSGPQARAVAEKVVHFASAPHWLSWSARLAELPDPAGHAVDHVVVTFFQAPRSYTAEDVVEIGCHGSPSSCAIAWSAPARWARAWPSPANSRCERS